MSWVEYLQKFFLLSYLLIVNSPPLQVTLWHCFSLYFNSQVTWKLKPFAMTRGMLTVFSFLTKCEFGPSVAFQVILHLGLSSFACNFNVNSIWYIMYMPDTTFALGDSWNQFCWASGASFSAQKQITGKLGRALKPLWSGHVSVATPCTCITLHHICFSGTIGALIYSD